MKKSFGQHLLKDKNYLNKIIKSLNLATDDIILEIGSGTGLLTLELAKTAQKVFAIEIERNILKKLRKNLSDKKLDNVEVVETDFLKLDLNNLSKKSFIVVGNIPYNLTAKILIKLFGEIDKIAPHIDLFKDVYLMLQLEVAKRIVAVPGTKAYSPLTLLVQYFCKPEILFEVPADAFSPKPKVDSAFVVFNKKETLEVLDNPTFLKQVIRTSFRERRKKIINTLYKLVKDKQPVRNIFEECGLDYNLRPEAISFDQYINISRLVSAYRRRCSDVALRGGFP